MRKLFTALLLTIVPLLASATPGTVAKVLEAQRLRGYHSAATAIEELHLAGQGMDATDGLELRMAYHAALARLAVDARQPEVLAGAEAQLADMAQQENCRRCALHLLVVRVHDAVRNDSPEVAASLLEKARSLLADAEPTDKLAFAIAEAATQDALGNLATAIEQTMAALHQAEALGNTAERVRLTLMLIGPSADLGHTANAESMADEVIALASPLGYVEATALAHLTKGYLYARAGKREQQLQSLQQALDLSEGDEGLKRVEAITRANLADYYLHLQDNPTALAHASQAQKLAVELGDRVAEATAMANAGIAIGRMGDLDAGLGQLKQAMALADTLGEGVIKVDIAREAVRLLAAAGRHREALEMLQEAFSLNEEITRQERDEQVTELQARYDTERKNREIERLSTNNKLREAELVARSSRQQLWVAITIALALAAMLMGQWLTRSRRLANQLSKANASLTVESAQDALTGAFNRRHFDRLMLELAEQGTEFGLLVLDLDHFKRINDTHGHEAGDAVLAEVSRRLRGLLRDRDAVVRWGGEEFVLVLPGAAAAGLAALCDRVVREIGGQPMSTGSVSVPITVSVGAVRHPAAPSCDWERALRLADAAMYLAKQSGRNRAVCLGNIGDAGVIEPTPAGLVAAEQQGHLDLVRIPGPSVVSEDAPAQF